MPYPSYNYSMYPPMGVPAYPNTQQPAPQQNTAQPEQLINGGFAVVPTVDDIKKYPVAPGNFMLFKLQNTPYIIEKSMGYSQLDDPHYRFFEEIDKDIMNETPKDDKKEKPSQYEEEIGDIKESISRMDKQIEELKDGLSSVKKSIKPVPKKKVRDEEEGDSDE